MKATHQTKVSGPGLTGRVEVCRVCSNAVVDPRPLAAALEAHFVGESGKPPAHRRFRVALAGCPNGCSLPQLRDFGAMGQLVPAVTSETCTECEACLNACREGAIRLPGSGPEIDFSLCVNCGDCVAVCPTGTLEVGPRGYRVLIGGKAGRHPRWATVLRGLASDSEVADLLAESLAALSRLAPDESRLGAAIEHYGWQPFWQALGGGGGTVRTVDRNLGEFLDDLGSARVPPSAGIALAVAGGLGAALVEMVANLAPTEAGLADLAEKARDLRGRILAAGDRDQDAVRSWLQQRNVDLNAPLLELIALAEETEELTRAVLAAGPEVARLDALVGLRLAGTVLKTAAEVVAGNGGEPTSAVSSALQRSEARQAVNRADL